MKRIGILSSVFSLFLAVSSCVNTPANTETGSERAHVSAELVLGDFEAESWKYPMGVWIAEDDSARGGTSVATMGRVTGQGGSTGAMRIDYTLGKGNPSPSALVRIAMDSPENFSTYKSLSFSLRGSGNALKVQIGMKLITDANYHEHMIYQTPAEWTEYTIPVRKLAQANRSNRKKLEMNLIALIQFRTASRTEGEKGWFELDNVKLLADEKGFSAKGEVKPNPVVATDTAADGCYIGVFGPGYESSFAKIAGLESGIGRKFAQIMWYIDWSREFPAAECEELTAQGYVPHITWESWIAGDKFSFTLDQVLSGKWDAYVTGFAKAARAFGKPLFLRWGHEFNGNWYPWSVPRNDMDAGKYVKVFRYLHDIFTKEGASNVMWIWSANNSSVPDEPRNRFSNAYPGDAYVDWVGIDGYNFGHHPDFDYGWNSFSDIFSDVYVSMVQNYPDKPIMLSEFASGPIGGDKREWLKQMGEELPVKFPAVKSIVWFNIDKETDWTLDSDWAMAGTAHAVFKNEYFCSSYDGLIGIGATFVGNKRKYADALKLIIKEKIPVQAKKLAKPLAIDGDLSDWPKNAARIVVNRKESVAAEGKDGWKDDRDLSAAVSVAWDDSSLYLGCNVTDDFPLVTTFTNGDSWQGDCVEFVFGANPKDDPKRILYSSGDYQFLMNPGNASDIKPHLWNHYKSKIAIGEARAVKTDKGYVFEVRIDWKTFGDMKPQTGVGYGFNFAIDDADEAGTRETQALWYGKKTFYKDPSIWSEIIFVK